MARSNNISADIARVEGMSEAEFAAQWGEWAERRDKDPRKVQRRWVRELKAALPHAQAEDAAVADLVAAKDNYRADPNPTTKAAKDAAVAAVQALRQTERATRKGVRIVGDAFTNADEVL